MPSRVLLRLGALAAMLAGVLRIGASFLEYSEPVTASREMFYLVIDLSILFGLLAIYFCQHVELGKLGLAGFAFALTGAAIIVGPDGSIGGASMYQIGSASLLLGLTLIAIAGWPGARLPRTALASWPLSLILAASGSLPGAPSALLTVAGISFGIGFVGAGAGIWWRDVAS